MKLKTRIRSTAIRVLSSSGYMSFLRNKARLKRSLSGGEPVVHYFHQVDDPYSHLVVQKLEQLRAAYSLTFKNYLVSKPSAEFQGSSEHFDNWALRDALGVAQDYGTTLPADIHATHRPEPGTVLTANNLLAPHLDNPDFPRVAFAVGNKLWSSESLENKPGQQQGEVSVQKGDALRLKLGHYQGGMFHFDGEWFWGIDRIRLLEYRLVEEGFAREATGNICVPEPETVPIANSTSSEGNSDIKLEYFLSLRSPYSAIGHQRILDLLSESGVTLKLRPVMPMLMRGIPAPRAKQQYIITDAAREARARGIPFGNIVDPFGEPVKRAFALFPAAVAIGQGMQFVTSYLAASWAEGVDITTETGLRQVVANAGIDWDELQRAALGSDWERVLEDNLQDMLAAGLWGVPSFRVSGGNTDSNYVCWGQDRIWRVAKEIARRA